MAILIAADLRKTYSGGASPVEAVRGVNLELRAGDFVALMGPSGCGKSTLLHLCGAMDRPTSGRLEIAQTVLSELDDDRLTRLRRERIGFVFQFFNLLPTLNVSENVALPLQLAGIKPRDASERARRILERVGLGHRLTHYPQQLSGGEMQRVAIARAVVHQPVLLIADEPTGNLDSANGALIMELLRELNAELGLTILLATHSSETASVAHRIVQMRDGQIERVSHASGVEGSLPLATL